MALLNACKRDLPLRIVSRDRKVHSSNGGCPFIDDLLASWQRRSSSRRLSSRRLSAATCRKPHPQPHTHPHTTAGLHRDGKTERALHKAAERDKGRARGMVGVDHDMLSGKGVVGLGLGDFRLELHQLRNHIRIGASQNREPWQPLRDDSGNPETQTELCWRDSQER